MEQFFITKKQPNMPYNIPNYPMLGYNNRMTDIQAAIGLVQLSRLDSFIRERERMANYYTEQLEGITWLQIPKSNEKCKHVWQSYICQVKADVYPVQRADILEMLYRNGISSRIGTHAVHMLDYYRVKYNIPPEKFPFSRDAYKNSFAIPLHNKLSMEDCQYVVKCLKSIG